MLPRHSKVTVKKHTGGFKLFCALWCDVENCCYGEGKIRVHLLGIGSKPKNNTLSNWSEALISQQFHEISKMCGEWKPKTALSFRRDQNLNLTNEWHSDILTYPNNLKGPKWKKVDFWISLPACWILMLWDCRLGRLPSQSVSIRLLKREFLQIVPVMV